MKKSISEIFLTIWNEQLTEAEKKQREKIITVGAILLSVISIAYAVNNISAQHYFAAGINLILLAGSIIVAVCSGIKKDWNTASFMVCVLIAIGFTIDSIYGVNQGFAVLWMVVIPMISMAMMGIKWGTFLSWYFQIFLIALFYTPLRGLVSSDYDAGMLRNFPTLYFVCMLAAYFYGIQSAVNRNRQREYEETLQKAVADEHNKVMSISLQTIMSISNAVDAKDRYTRQHSLRVAEYSKLIAEELNWSEEKTEQIYRIALLHDIGKIGVNEQILNKADKLTSEAYQKMKLHTVIGGEILKDLSLVPNVALGAKYHHERYDGNGYPEGLAGKNIPIEARVIAVADAFDAMNSNRVYRKRLSNDQILRELKQGRGTHFDPDIIDVFWDIAEEILNENNNNEIEKA